MCAIILNVHHNIVRNQRSTSMININKHQGVWTELGNQF